MFAFLGILLGITLLIAGGFALVSGASRIASKYGVPPMIIGLTVVGFGTSAPELVVNILGAITGETELAFGNVIGSNISNLGLVLGAAALIQSIDLRGKVIQREIPLLLLITTIMTVMALDGVFEHRAPRFSQSDAIVLVLLFGIFIYITVPLSTFLITGLVGQPGYMSWQDAKHMAVSRLVTIGSHTVNHRNLRQLSADEVRFELSSSKARIEDVLGMRCDHFCCPWGRPDRDFRTDRDPAIALELGYRSFLTTRRGLTRTGDRLPLVKRDVIGMDSSPAELRHFLF
jgi:hypothetical protein